MNNSDIYFDFVESHGDVIYEGGGKYLSLSDARKALNLAKGAGLIILGGDVVSREGDEFGYARHLWGAEYIYLDWYCNRRGDESDEMVSVRSYEIAINALKAVEEVSHKLNKEVFVILVVK